MTSFLSEFNWTLIFMVVLVSAVVAYVGDVVGMRIGKRRISLFGLRPRYTSQIITLLTGVGIAVATLVAAGSMSESVRASLFGMKYMQGELVRLTAQSRTLQEELDTAALDSINKQAELAAATKSLDAASGDLSVMRQDVASLRETAAELENSRAALKSQVTTLEGQRASMEKSVASLRAESEKLKAGLSEMKERKVIASSGSLLAQTTLTASPTRGDVSNAYERLIVEARETVRKEAQAGAIAGAVPSFKNLEVRIESDASMRNKLLASKQRSVLRLIATANVVQGQPVVGMIKVFPSKLVFSKDDVLLRVIIPTSKMKQEEAADFLYTLLVKDLNRKAVSQGVLPNPISGSVGGMDSLAFYDAVDHISAANANAELRVVAVEDIYSEGPVNVKIEISEK